jgi:TonB family protein
VSRRTASKSGPQPGKQRRRQLRFWLVIAGFVHLELVLFVGIVAYLAAPRNADLVTRSDQTDALAGGEPLEVTTLDDQTTREILAELEQAEEKAKEEQAKKEIESTEAPGQTVQIARPLEEKRPDKARFAAEYDSSVEKETRKLGRFDADARAGSATGEAKENKPTTPAVAAQPRSQPMPPGALAMRTPGAPGKGPSAQRPTPVEPTPLPEASQPGDGPAEAEDPTGLRMPGGRLALRPPLVGGGVNGQGGSRPLMPPGREALSPTQEQIARAVNSGTDDHLRDIDDGDETSLNAKKWKFASFFNRVKAQVREHWRPEEAYHRRDPTGQLYGQKDRYTLLRVQLKPDGSLANVALHTPSGVEFLDDEAVEAFKQAQPFPNPPRALVQGDTGLIDFNFGFFFELSGAPRLKLMRFNKL